mgnify:CR=1 FL=1
MKLIALIPSALSGQGFIAFAQDAQGRRRTGYGATFLSAWNDAVSPAPERRAERMREADAVGALDPRLLQWESAR